jgi:hypothetical protein
MFQFIIVFGILVAYASNALLANLGENTRCWMVGVAAFSSLLNTPFPLALVESPRRLITHSGNRATGQALGSSTHWIFAAMQTPFSPIMAEPMAPGTIFALFCFMMLLQLPWVRFMAHETKGVLLEKTLQELGIESSK